MKSMSKSWLPNLNVFLVLLLLVGLVVPITTLLVIPPTPAYAASDDWAIVASTDDAGTRSGDYFSLTWVINPAGAATTYSAYGCGLRYQNINIPKGYTIITAYITFTSYDALAGTDTYTTFYGSDEDDAATFSTLENFNTRRAATTTAKADWDDMDAWTGGAEYQSPELKTIIQEIVNRGSWSSGNDLAIFWDDRDDRSTHLDGNQRRAISYDEDTAKTPILHVEWTGPAPTMSTQPATDVTKTTATGHGYINATFENCTVRGFEWDIDSGAPYANEEHANGSFGTGAYTLALEGMPADDTIYYRSYAINLGGTGHGNEMSFETLTAAAPGVATGSIVGYGSTYIVGSGTVVAINNTAVTEVGIEWGLSDAYGYSETEGRTIFSAGTTFTVRADGLPPASEIHYRMTAKNTDNLWGHGIDRIFHTSGSYALYEYWHTGDDTDVDIYGNNWFAQTFTTGSDVGHTVGQARAKLFIVGAPGTLEYYIYRTSDDDPTGLPIASGDIRADSLTTSTDGAWYTLTMEEEATLSADTLYALALAAPNGDSSNKVSWRVDTDTAYADGAQEGSTDGGVSWSSTAANDLMFEIWGDAALRIFGAKVFENFLETDDRLVVFSYQAIVGTDYDHELPQSYFSTQLRRSGTVIGQGKMKMWGHRPGSLYFRADEVTIPWGGNMTTVDFVGINATAFEGAIAEYSLVGADWLGQDLRLLDDWVLATVGAIEDFYGLLLTTNVDGRTVLADEGATIFITGIPGLVEIRPNLFAVSARVSYSVDVTHDESFRTDVESGYTGRFKTATEDIGTLFGVDGEFIGGGFWGWAVIMGVAVIGGAGTIVGPALIALSLPFIGIGVVQGAIDINWLILPAFLLVLYIAAKFTIWRT